MKWFYFVDSKGNRHYSNTREEAERIRKEVGGGFVIIETNTRPGFLPKSTPQGLTGTPNNNSAMPAVISPLNNDTSWLCSTKELVYGQNKLVPALQIYHPTRSELHSETDKRILRLKDVSQYAVAHYSAALKIVLPRNQTILLCCAPGSTPSSNSGLVEIIRRISGGPLIDGSSILRTQTARQRKSIGARFDDHELASTIAIHAFPLPPQARILVIDDVVTSGQTLRICTSILRDAYPSCSISCLALSSTDYESTAVGIADKLELTSINEALKPLHDPSHRPKAVINKLTTGPSAAPLRPGSNVTQSSLVRNAQPRLEATGNNSNRKQSPSSNSGDCFVVTAIYDGDKSHPNVMKLRRFRDQRIAALPGGDKIIQCYKCIGPVLAVLVAKTGLSRPLRSVLDYCLEKGGRKL